MSSFVFVFDLMLDIWLHDMDMRRDDSGQVGLILIVIMGALIALSMSVASRTVSDLLLSRQESESSSVFNVAETGVEEALNRLRSEGDSMTGSITGTVGDDVFASGEYEASESYGLGFFIEEGEVIEVDLDGYTGTDIDLFWTLKNDDENVACVGEGSGNAPAGVEVIQVASDYTISHDYYNPYNCNPGGNNFDGSAGDGGNFRSRIVVSLIPSASIIRVRPIYSGTTIEVSGDSSLSSQSFVVRSYAEGGDARNDIEVKRSNLKADGIFDYALFSSISIVK